MLGFCTFCGAKAQCTVYKGRTGWEIVARVDRGTVLSRPSGFSVLARLKDSKVYSGAAGWDVIARIDKNTVYSGFTGWTILGRVKGNEMYKGAAGWDVIAHGKGCDAESLAAAVVACRL